MTSITSGKALTALIAIAVTVGSLTYVKSKQNPTVPVGSIAEQHEDQPINRPKPPQIDFATVQKERAMTAELKSSDAPVIQAPKQELIPTLDTKVPEVTGCDLDCQADILAKLRAGESLSPYEIEALRLFSYDMTQMMPLTDADIAMFEADLMGDDERRKAAAKSLLSEMDTETQTRIGMNLTGSSESESRLIGYDFLAKTASQDPNAAQHLRNALILETDNNILYEVIESGELDVENQMSSGNYEARSIALDTLYTTHTDPNVRGAALMAQSKIMQNHAQLQGDIREALISDSSDLHDYALNSLAIVLRRQSEQEGNAQWIENSDMRSLLEAFAADPNSNEEIRESAEKILSRYFSN